MGTIRVQGKELETDEDGFIQDFDAWSEEIAQQMATADGAGTLTPEHWKVIYFLRDHYRQVGFAPPIRMLVKETFSLNHIYKLFPAGPARGACKWAGLPKPTGCV
jgi:tRNA 2-thiouridine synthesizing protein E